MNNEIKLFDVDLEKTKAVIPDKAFTHSGMFHADDVLSAAFLKTLNPDIKIERGPVVPENYDGLVFDIGLGKFDHHQKDNEKRENGIPYASLGKLWREFAPLLGFNQKSIEHFDRTFCQHIDLSDNTPAYNMYSNMIKSKNSLPGMSSDEKFNYAVEKCIEDLQLKLREEKERVPAQEFADRYYNNAINKEIIVLNEPAPRDTIDCLVNTEAKFVILKSDREGYMINAVNKTEGEKESKMLLPKEWSGTRDEIEAINGIPMVFVHNGRFCGAAQTLEGAVKCAVLALNEEVKYDEKYDKLVESILNNEPYIQMELGPELLNDPVVYTKPEIEIHEFTGSGIHELDDAKKNNHNNHNNHNDNYDEH